jgi:hypothetical protein
MCAKHGADHLEQTELFLSHAHTSDFQKKKILLHLKFNLGFFFLPRERYCLRQLALLYE